MTDKKRGGSGRGQGRKKVLGDAVHQYAAGSKCEELWRQLEVRLALDKYERDPATEMIRVAQSRANLISMRFRKVPTSRTTMEEVGGDIEAALEQRPSRYRPDNPLLQFAEGPSRREVHIQVTRPKNAKAQVIKEAIIWFKETYGVELGQYRMRRYWDKYRSLETKLKSFAYPSGLFTSDLSSDEARVEAEYFAGAETEVEPKKS